MKKYFLKGTPGFTLIELIIVMGIFTAVFSTIFLIYHVAVQVFTQEGNEAELRQAVETAMYGMVKDFRLAKEIKSASDQDITIWVDADGDETEDTNELITYSHSGVSGESLVRTQDSTDVDVLFDVVSFMLSYDNPLVGDIHLISVTITAQLGDKTVTLTSNVKPRNVD